MKAQYSIAGMTSGVVVGTDHAAGSDYRLFTKYGDGGTDINPLFRLNKRQGKQLLAALGCPEHLYKKAPTADLEDDRPSLPDEAALGVTYDNIDDYLEGKILDDTIAKKIESWYLKTEHKRRTPITVFDDFWKKRNPPSCITPDSNKASYVRRQQLHTCCFLINNRLLYWMNNQHPE